MEERAITDCELLVIKVIWSSEQALSIKDIQANVNSRYNKEWKVQTVSTFLARLVRKGYLRMERKGRSFFYYPLVSEAEYGKGEIVKCVDLWGNGKINALVSAFSSVRGLSDEEKKAIQEILDNGDSERN